MNNYKLYIKTRLFERVETYSDATAVRAMFEDYNRDVFDRPRITIKKMKAGGTRLAKKI
jgi:hypothetical protein